MRRPFLNPALHRVWRTDDTLQIGLDPDNALVLGGLDEPAGRWLETLDGTRTREQALDCATALGIPARTARRLLDLLQRAGVLDDAAQDSRALRVLALDDRERLAPDLASLSLRRPESPALPPEARAVAAVGAPAGSVARLGRRLDAAVTIHGAGRVGASLGCLLAAAGVGHVVIFDQGPVRPADLAPGGLVRAQVGTARATAAATAVRRIAPRTRTSLPSRRNHPDLAVLAPAGPPDRAAYPALLASGVPHLSTAVRETTGVVGPLVLPGQTCCVQCLDLYRSDRDPAWPRIAAQLSDPPTPPRGIPATAPCDIGLAAAVASQAALHALAFLDGELPPSVNGTVEITLPYGLARRRSWRPHPACRCRGQWDSE